jgi:hypothetical protein
MKGRERTGRKGLLALLLCAALALTGCASMLERSYAQESVHDRAPTTEEDSSILRAEDYRDLVSAVYYVVSQGLTAGTIRLYNYTRDVDSDLAAACLEVAREDPLGAYAVDYIKYDYTRIVSYYEATVEVVYRRTQEQVASMVSATGSSAIRAELQQAMAQFRPEVVLRISYFTEGTDIGQLLREAYYNAPATAMGLPEAEINIYPDQGSQRVVEVLLTYPLEAEQAQARAEELEQRVQALTEEHGVRPGESTAAGLASLLRRLADPDPEGGSTAYDALVGGRADSEGLALAFALLAQSADLEAQVVEGTVGEEPRFWNSLRLEEGTRYLDVTEGIALWTGEELQRMGYHWPEEPAQAEADGGENFSQNEN